MLPIAREMTGEPTRDVGKGVLVFITVASALVLLPIIWAYGTRPALLLGVGITLALLPWAILSLVLHPRSIPYLLITAIHLSLFGVKVQLGTLNLRPNMLVALAAAGIAGVRLLADGPRVQGVPFVGLFLATDAIYLLSTLINGGSRFFWRGVADCGLFLVNVLQYSLIVWFLSVDRKAFERAMRLFLYLGTVYAGLSVLTFTLGQLGIGAFRRLLEDFGGETGDFVRIGDLGTTTGTYVGFSVVVMLALLLLAPHSLPFPRGQFLLMLGANVAALLLTFARGPWLAVSLTAIALVAWMVIRFPLRTSALAVARLLLGLTLLAGVFTWMLLRRSPVPGMVLDRLTSYSSLDIGTAVDRLTLWENMYEDWKESPVLGHGAHNYSKFLDDPTLVSENFLLELLHSAGLIGFGIFAFVSAKMGIQAFRLFSGSDGIADMPWGLALLAGCVCMFTSSLTNPGMTGGYYWVCLGFLASAIQLGRARRNE
jgi:O-Antigen ligase